MDVHPRFVEDVNGDDLKDIVGITDAGVYVSLNTGANSFAPATLWVAHYGYTNGGWTHTYNPRHVADVDGDGKADIVGFGGVDVFVSLSTGSSFTSPTTWITAYTFNVGGWSDTKNPIHVVDVDGDGKKDIVGFSDHGVQVSLSTGTSFTPYSNWVSHYDFTPPLEGGKFPSTLVSFLMLTAMAFPTLSVLAVPVLGSH